jgi:hypothetical protein
MDSSLNVFPRTSVASNGSKRAISQNLHLSELHKMHRKYSVDWVTRRVQLATVYSVGPNPVKSNDVMGECCISEDENKSTAANIEMKIHNVKN